MATRQNYRCSFCGKAQDQVHRLIAGPGGVYICDECVVLCTEIINEDPSYSAAHGGWRALVAQRGRGTLRPATGQGAAAAAKEEEQDPGEWVFDTLQALGYALAVGDDGHITATSEQMNPETAPREIVGQVRPDGSIEWPDDAAVRKVLFYERVVELRRRGTPAGGRELD